MTKRINLILAVLLVGIYAHAQTAYTGIKGGVNFSNLFIDEVDDENVRLGIHAGFYTQLLAPSGNVGFQPEIAFSTKGARGTYNVFGYDGELKLNLNYLDVPLLMVIKLGEDAEVHLGPYASYLVYSSVSTEGDFGSAEDELDRDNFNTLDYGIAGGFALNFDPVSVGIRYNYGLQKIAKGDVAKELLGNSKNGNGQIFVAFNLK